ncbi:MAG: hypothetical protein HW406_1131 [Candidatus Brocadiaceae bacterium]|nr:hypothetical protein [Candidatus Brocadiaceae bacterium]
MRNDDICIDILHLVKYTHCCFDGIGALRFAQQKGEAKNVQYDMNDGTQSYLIKVDTGKGVLFEFCVNNFDSSNFNKKGEIL